MVKTSFRESHYSTTGVSEKTLEPAPPKNCSILASEAPMPVKRPKVAPTELLRSSGNLGACVTSSLARRGDPSGIKMTSAHEVDGAL